MSLEPRCRHGNIRSAEPCRDCDERDALRARIDELSRAYAVQGLALEEERTRVAELEVMFNAVLDDDWEQPDLAAYRVMRSGWKPE